MAEDLDILVEKQDDEEILFSVRRHVVPLGFSMILALILVLLPFVLMFWLFQYGGIGITIFFVLLGFACLFLMRIIVKWYYTVFVITSQRIVDVSQQGFFDRSISEARHDQITDIFHRKKGFLHHLFNYGDLTIQTFNATLKLKDIYRPGKVQQRILSDTNLSIDEEGDTKKKRGKAVKIKKKLQSGQDLDECELKGIMEFLKERVDKKRLVKELFEEDLKKKDKK